MSRHSKLTASSGGVHSAVAYTYATAAARIGATGFTTEDVGKLAWQTDDGSLWILTSAAPVWHQIILDTSGPDTLVVVPFNYTTTTLVLQAISAGDVVRFGQLTVVAAFGAGTQIKFGTSGSPGMFLDIQGNIQGSFRSDECTIISVDDLLMLTVVAVGAIGTGFLFYEV